MARRPSAEVHSPPYDNASRYRRRVSVGNSSTRNLSVSLTDSIRFATSGLQHAGLLNYPRKYCKNSLAEAYKRQQMKAPPREYSSTCQALGIEPNSFVAETLMDNGNPVSSARVLGGERIVLRNTYLGERGFIALMPLLDRNTSWTYLDASGNGLRNEAVLHLVDLLLQPHHMGRSIQLDLSRNPISEGAANALMELIRNHPLIEEVNIRMTKVPRRIIFKLQETLQAELKARAEAAAYVAAAEAANRRNSVMEETEEEVAAAEEPCEAAGGERGDAGLVTSDLVDGGVAESQLDAAAASSAAAVEEQGGSGADGDAVGCEEATADGTTPTARLSATAPPSVAPDGTTAATEAMLAAVPAFPAEADSGVADLADAPVPDALKAADEAAMAVEPAAAEDKTP